jgi:N-acetylneuraminate lyase
MSEIAAAAAGLPFYYYHIPSLTGSRLNMVEFLKSASRSINNLAGMKYTSTELHEFLDCVALDNGKWEIIWGVDEMLLGALAMGAKAAIGSTYNIAAPTYQRLITAFEKGDLQTARQLQLESIAMINTLKGYPFFAALKQILTRRGIALGGCRIPNGNLTPQQREQLESDLSLARFAI